MKTVTITKEYKHTARRTWQPGDTPTISSELADKIVGGGFGYVTNEGDTRMDMEEVDYQEKDYEAYQNPIAADKKKRKLSSNED